MALSHAGVLALILLVLGEIGQALLAQNLDRDATADAMSAAQQEVDRLVETGTLQSPPDSDVPSRSVVRLAVFTPAGLPVDNDERIPPWLLPRRQGVVDIVSSGEPVRVVTLDARRDGRLMAIVVAGRSLAPERALVHRVRTLLVVGGLGAIAASLGAGWWLAGRAARPIRRAYEAQAGFAADASHELRTQLAFVRTGLEVLAEHDPRLGGEVLSEIDYLTSLTARLLLLARADSGALHVEPQALDLKDLCREAAHRARVAHGLRLDVPAGNGVLVKADRVATEAALDVLLENVAVHGGGEAEIRCEESRDSAVVAVIDHGQGLPPGTERAAFERFFRADPARTHDANGMGLGLAIARSLVEAEGGRVWLEPSPGGGLTARVSLPRA
jgi:signal transduction histidine kinase